MTKDEKKRRQYQSDLAKLKAIRNKTSITLQTIKDLELSIQLLRRARTKHLSPSS